MQNIQTGRRQDCLIEGNSIEGLYTFSRIVVVCITHL